MREKNHVKKKEYRTWIIVFCSKKDITRPFTTYSINRPQKLRVESFVLLYCGWSPTHCWSLLFMKLFIFLFRDFSTEVFSYDKFFFVIVKRTVYEEFHYKGRGLYYLYILATKYWSARVNDAPWMPHKSARRVIKRAVTPLEPAFIIDKGCINFAYARCCSRCQHKF